MAQRDDDTGEATQKHAQDDESSFVATARDVIARRETLLDALHE
jgi:prophage DNA circulation protein